MRDKKYNKIVYGFYHKYCDMEITLETMKSIEKDYREQVCPALCRYNFGLSRKQALWLCDTLGQGNWKKMWLTEEEKSETDKEICKTLIGEVHYCADRMSWDRLTRINWQYHRLLKCIEQRKEKSEM